MDASHIRSTIFALAFALVLFSLEIWVVKLPEWLFYPIMALAMGGMIWGIWPWLFDVIEFLRTIRCRWPIYVETELNVRNQNDLKSTFALEKNFGIEILRWTKNQ